MQQKLIIQGRLEGRNIAENKARTHWSLGAKLKKEQTEIVYYSCKAQNIRQAIHPTIIVEFFEKDSRRDSDNVISSLKYILDGLVLAKVIENDNRKSYELQINLPVQVDKLNPRIEIIIESKE